MAPAVGAPRAVGGFRPGGKMQQTSPRDREGRLLKVAAEWEGYRWIKDADVAIVSTLLWHVLVEPEAPDPLHTNLYRRQHVHVCDYYTYPSGPAASPGPSALEIILNAPDRSGIALAAVEHLKTAPCAWIHLSLDQARALDTALYTSLSHSAAHIVELRS